MKLPNAYQQSTDWLFSRFLSYQNLGAVAYKPGLERVHQLLDILQIDANKLPSIHIAGTNGKGSTAAYCASLLQESGLKVGLFTSPHIYDFSERIRINGRPIGQQAVIGFCNKYKALNAAIDASFFELTFAMALCYFQEQACDYIVIETGLGGRLDATNVLLPQVCIITNIALDHQELLGATLSEIALEKAGIIKRQIPIVIGQKNSTILGIFEGKSNDLDAALYFSEDIQCPLEGLPLMGYQKNNFKTALIALRTINFDFSLEQQRSALENLQPNTGFYGRFEIIQNTPKIVVDASHNPAGITATLPLIESACKGKLFILYGASTDKDAHEILKLFPKNALLAACVFSNPRSKTREQWRQLGVDTIYDNIHLALEAIQKQMQAIDLLWITGSFFLISELPIKKKIF